MRKIYCAGPLFNPKEREEMAEIAAHLESAGYSVFLPQRDGLELTRISLHLTRLGMPDEDANDLLAKAIFHIDTFQVADSDGLVLNLNGRVPDEGAMVEAGIAWSLGKPIVIYKNDSRSALLGLDNPLVLGLSSFKTVSELSDIAPEFHRHFANGYAGRRLNLSDPEFKPYKYGKQLHRIFTRHSINLINAERLNKIL